MAATGRLYINDNYVGDVIIKSLADSWGFGDFQPNERFAEFAGLFGRWSLLMHADDNDAMLSQAAGDELRRVELAIDGLRTVLELPPHNQRVRLDQLNIDGPLIEWKIGGRCQS